ncbi:MAG: 4'-phosphopantetheinyl transferase superfamily protein [Planctomycetes bacterium]|nr:4'-phosphopantetheinyl transferase superfamily protein [Planctomycetota bacterium]MBU4399521.1 4'-phosphopantetheinyl transferase superfamily protein [Planctomycetota bacterium]MCG2684684.1 4'-phosphopantetheinyl transferase superfamily protein [Planctomycetales bacterium]
MPRLRLNARRIDLWHVPLDEAADPTLFDEYRSLLSHEELQRLQRFTHDESRRLFLVGRALLRKTLSQYTGHAPRGLEFRYNAHGKPSLKTPVETPLEFSVSHTRGLAVCVVALGDPVGVDVERDRTVSNPLEIAGRFFAPAEAAALEKLPVERRNAAFIELWTLREAFVKARGVGLTTRPADFAFSLSADREATVSFSESSEERPGDWQFARFRFAAHYRVALAINRPASERPAILFRPAMPC